MEDEEKLNQIGESYKTGKMMTSEIKNILIDLLVKLVETHQVLFSYFRLRKN